jgi:uncharacterized membrane protein YgdD (TMEM256/DUF423 family)
MAMATPSAAVTNSVVMVGAAFMLTFMRLWLGLAAVNGALAVAAGAFAVHGLRAHLSPNLLEVWETGARYHMYHALAMGLAAIAGSRWSPALFLGGIVLFCGSLYVLALSGLGWLGAITPLGGVLLIAGWICLGVSSFRQKPS